MRTLEFQRVTPTSVYLLERNGWRIAAASLFSDGAVAVLMVREVLVPEPEKPREAIP